ncbi:MAG: N-acetylneuraminate synthase family protein, partial [Chitinophagales bacterium]
MPELQKIININGKKIGGNNRPYIIAEMACAHDGSFEKVKQLIDASVAANADAVQLQFFDTDSVVTPHHDVYGILKNIQFNAEEWTELFEYGKSQGIDVFVCTYDVPSVELAIKLKADGIKLNSSDLNNPDVLVEVAKTGIPFTLGAGASTLEEISNGLRLAVENGAKGVILMHGVQNFP